MRKSGHLREEVPFCEGKVIQLGGRALNVNSFSVAYHKTPSVVSDGRNSSFKSMSEALSSGGVSFSTTGEIESHFRA